jgi:hypothetical protein
MNSRASALQCEEPVAVGGGTNDMRHQADVRFGHRRWTERQHCKGQLSADCD